MCFFQVPSVNPTVNTAVILTAIIVPVVPAVVAVAVIVITVVHAAVTTAATVEGEWSRINLLSVRHQCDILSVDIGRSGRTDPLKS